MNGSTSSDHATEARRRIQQNAAAIGITSSYISKLVDSFYAEIRANPELGPIFEQSFGESWEEHLRKMKQFWASVALNSGEYAGKPVQVHQTLASRPHLPLEPQHFKIWLSIFRRVVAETSPTPQAGAFFGERATRIAQSLQMAIAFQTPDRPDPAARDEKELRRLGAAERAEALESGKG